MQINHEWTRMNTNEDKLVAAFGARWQWQLNGDAQRRLEKQPIGGLIRVHSCPFVVFR